MKTLSLIQYLMLVKLFGKHFGFCQAEGLHLEEWMAQ
jgi:hypothetical protein